LQCASVRIQRDDQIGALRHFFENVARQALVMRHEVP
jgi:hypothetical protein